MYDAIIIGCGPAGMTSAIYMARAGKKVCVLEKETIGGQMSSAPLIENYPGYKSISGSELADNMFSQMTSLGVEIELEEVKKIEDGKIKEVITEENTYKTKSIIIATGSKYRLLGLENEENLIGCGIHFCVSCDGAFYKNKEVAVIGGGNSAVINALALSNICTKVYLIQNAKHLTAEKALIEKVILKNNIEIKVNTKVEKIIGEERLTSLLLKTEENIEELKVDGMFIAIGLVPQNEVVKGILKINAYGYIEAKEGMTDIPGIFVAGDCREKRVRQLTVATGDGTIAAINAITYLEGSTI